MFLTDRIFYRESGWLRTWVLGIIVLSQVAQIALLVAVIFGQMSALQTRNEAVSAIIGGVTANSNAISSLSQKIGQIDSLVSRLDRVSLELISRRYRIEHLESAVSDINRKSGESQ